MRFGSQEEMQESAGGRDPHSWSEGGFVSDDSEKSEVTMGSA